MSRYHNSLYIGDISERVKILESCGQLTLAYVTAKVYNLNEDAERISQFLIESNIKIPDLTKCIRKFKMFIATNTNTNT